MDLEHSHPHLRVRVGIDNHKIWVQAQDPDPDLDGVMEMEMEVGVMILDVNEEEEGGRGIDLNHQRGIGIVGTELVERTLPLAQITIKINHKKGKGKDPHHHPTQYQRLHLKSIWRVSTYQLSIRWILLRGRPWVRLGRVVEGLNLVRWN